MELIHRRRKPKVIPKDSEAEDDEVNKKVIS